jgi:TonB C terminal
VSRPAIACLRGLAAAWLVAAACATADPWQPGDPPPPGWGPLDPSIGREESPAARPYFPDPNRQKTPPPWAEPDIPCSAGPHAFLPALEARVLYRVRPPVGLVPVSMAGAPKGGGLRVKVAMEIDRRGTIRRSVVAMSSGIFELDHAVQRAIEAAGCMPAPAKALLDAHGGTFKVSLFYLFGRV